MSMSSLDRPLLQNTLLGLRIVGQAAIRIGLPAATTRKLRCSRHKRKVWSPILADRGGPACKSCVIKISGSACISSWPGTIA